MRGVHPMLGSFDGPAFIRDLESAIRDREQAEAEERAKKEQLADELSAAIDKGDAWATCFFAGKRNVRCKDGATVLVRDNLGDVLQESLETSTGPSFHDVASFLLEKAGEGDEKAQGLLDRMAAAWVDMQ